jgi:hypothetical protein
VAPGRPARPLITAVAGSPASGAVTNPTRPSDPGRGGAQRSIASAPPASAGLAQVTRPAGLPRQPGAGGAVDGADRRVYSEAFAVAAAVSYAGLPSALPAQQAAALAAAGEGSHRLLRRYGIPAAELAARSSPTGWVPGARHAGTSRLGPPVPPRPPIGAVSASSRASLSSPGTSAPAYAAQPGRVSPVRTTGRAVTVIGRSSSSNASWGTPTGSTRPYGPGVPSLLPHALSPIERPGDGRRPPPRIRPTAPTHPDRPGVSRLLPHALGPVERPGDGRHTRGSVHPTAPVRLARPLITAVAGTQALGPATIPAPADGPARPRAQRSIASEPTASAGLAEVSRSAPRHRDPGAQPAGEGRAPG